VRVEAVEAQTLDISEAASWKKFFRYLKTGFADKLCDPVCVEPCRVVLHTQGVSLTIEAETANTVDLMDFGKRKRHGLRWRRSVVIKDFHCGHRRRITRSGSLKKLRIT